MLYWKRNEKLEKDRRKKAEKAQQEKRKKEEEEREARRQQRKFNFLITQTELYAHFMQKKMGQTSGERKGETAGSRSWGLGAVCSRSLVA